MALTVEEAIARVPKWAGAPEIQVTPLEGGITNRNYRVDVGGKSYQLRIPGNNTRMLGIDRHHEYHANLVAGELGIAPEVVEFIEPEGILVTRFIEGRHLDIQDMRKPENILRVVETLQNVHALPTLPSEFSAFQVVRVYAEAVRQHGAALPENFRWLLHQANEMETLLKDQPFSPRPCHNDLLNGNFLLGERMYLLDWEYAGMGDVFFDLANFSNNHGLSENEDQLLLDCYFGEVRARDLVHLRIMKMMSDFREAMWGLVQVGISDLAFDFQVYADKHFERLTQQALDPNWEHWLRELQ